MHDMTLGEGAESAHMSKAGLAKIVDRDPTRRSYLKTETAMRLAEVFGVGLSDLYEKPALALNASSRRMLEIAAEAGQ
jgi:ABC-type branched-subunit amino acid transport system ATPase component